MKAGMLTRIPTDSERDFLDEARRQLATNHRAIRYYLRQLDDGQVARRPSDESSSIARMVLRLCADVEHQILSVVGGLPACWDRPAESPERGTISRDELLARLDTSVDRADAVLAVITPDRLREARESKGPGRAVEVTVLTVIFRALVELAGQTREVASLTRSRPGDRPEFESPARDGCHDRLGTAVRGGAVCRL
jgi:hypothetical protein